jgi:hypothetical protein
MVRMKFLNENFSLKKTYGGADRYVQKHNRIIGVLQLGLYLIPGRHYHGFLLEK